jgi:hypothetical protein
MGVTFSSETTVGFQRNKRRTPEDSTHKWLSAHCQINIDVLPIAALNNILEDL